MNESSEQEQAAFRSLVDRIRGYFLTQDGRPREKGFAGTGFKAQECPSPEAWRAHRQRAADLSPLVADAIRAFRRDLNVVMARGIWRIFAVAMDQYQRTLDSRALVDFSGVLDRAIDEAGLDRDEIYVTNIVKHFRFVLRGKKRIHKKPDMEQIRACTPWLEAELARIKPEVLVLLGATAAQALLGRAFRVTQQRGTFVESALAPLVTATVHPSSILRSRTEEDRREAFDGLVADLRVVRRGLSAASA